MNIKILKVSDRNVVFYTIESESTKHVYEMEICGEMVMAVCDSFRGKRAGDASIAVEIPQTIAWFHKFLGVRLSTLEMFKIAKDESMIPLIHEMYLSRKNNPALIGDHKFAHTFSTN